MPAPIVDPTPGERKEKGQGRRVGDSFNWSHHLDIHEREDSEYSDTRSHQVHSLHSAAAGDAQWTLTHDDNFFVIEKMLRCSCRGEVLVPSLPCRLRIERCITAAMYSLQPR